MSSNSLYRIMYLDPKLSPGARRTLFKIALFPASGTSLTRFVTTPT
nr:MAG TPA: hypothetical protein [Caudoviricetes sp.]